jgi:two-component system LytT family response regulator
MQINCIILEDEPLAQERTRNYIQKIPFLNLLAAFDNAMEAIPFLKSTKVDLIFLDINMGEFSGIQLLETIDTESQVIITTAYHEYALKGFDLNVTDYLLKPFSFERFLQAVGRAQNNLFRKETVPDEKFVFVKTEYRLEKLLFSELLYIEGMRDYRSIHTTRKRIMTLQTFRDFEQQIPSHILCRVHKSFMVAIDKIESIERDGLKIQESIIPISETYRQAFLQLIGR